jgi:energy-coupling factor transporter transmembrane protein EcfT
LTVAVSGAWIANFAQNPFIYYFLNLGIPFMLAIASFYWRGHEELKGTLLFLVLVPNVLLLTPNPWDMYKFFMFAWVPIVVLSGVVLAKVWVRRWRIVVLGLILLSIMTSASVVIFNVGTEYTAVNWSEYKIGLWVRENTPENSVFLTYYSIHAPSSMIGGRLRVSSYVNWPYGHGIPLDQVLQREDDIDAAYAGTEIQLATVVREYNVSYVYVGGEEINNYHNCVARFDAVRWLTQVYVDGNLRIYQVNSTQIDN